jgi:alpha-L-arabinofuranosidase
MIYKRTCACGNAIETTIHFSGKAVDGSAGVATLTADSLLEWDSFENPDRVKIARSQTSIEQNGLRHVFPAHSISRLTVRVK